MPCAALAAPAAPRAGRGRFRRHVHAERLAARAVGAAAEARGERRRRRACGVIRRESEPSSDRTRPGPSPRVGLRRVRGFRRGVRPFARGVRPRDARGSRFGERQGIVVPPDARERSRVGRRRPRAVARWPGVCFFFLFLGEGVERVGGTARAAGARRVGGGGARADGGGAAARDAPAPALEAEAAAGGDRSLRQGARGGGGGGGGARRARAEQSAEAGGNGQPHVSEGVKKTRAPGDEIDVRRVTREAGGETTRRRVEAWMKKTGSVS